MVLGAGRPSASLSASIRVEQEDYHQTYLRWQTRPCRHLRHPRLHRRRCDPRLHPHPRHRPHLHHRHYPHHHLHPDPLPHRRRRIHPRPRDLYICLAVVAC